MIKIAKFTIIVCALLFVGCGNKGSGMLNRSICSVSQDENFGLILDALRSRSYKKFSNYISCLDDINEKNDSGITLLMFASGYVEFIASPSEVEKFKSGLATNLNDPYVFVSDLLEKGADPNLADKQGHTALFSAIYHGRIASAWLILRKGGNPNISSENGVTPIIMAAEHCNLIAYELLKSFGANEEAKNPEGVSGQLLYKKCQY